MLRLLVSLLIVNGTVSLLKLQSVTFVKIVMARHDSVNPNMHLASRRKFQRLNSKTTNMIKVQELF